jgi:hypothetical protein
MFYFNYEPVFTYFDNDGDGDGGDDNANKPETFTPEQVQSMLSEEQAKYQTERTKLAQQLEEIQHTSSLNQKQKTELEEQVTALREASMTAEERAKAAVERKEQDYNEKVAALAEEGKEWKQKYTQTRIKNSILTAANGNEEKPYHSEDIFNALGTSTILKELTDDIGKGTGEFDVVVKFSDVDGDGKAVIVEMDPQQAVGKMSKMKRWAHLFRSNKVSGSGGSASTDTEELNIEELAASDPEKFLELTKKHPELLT